jgi:hypothetical protein
LVVTCGFFVSFESENDETLPNFNNNKESSQERERKRNKGGAKIRVQASKQPKNGFLGGPQGGNGTTKTISSGAQYVILHSE